MLFFLHQTVLVVQKNTSFLRGIQLYDGVPHGAKVVNVAWTCLQGDLYGFHG